MGEGILEAKITLYTLLLCLDEESITDNEVELLYYLSKDEQIQKKLSDAR